MGQYLHKNKKKKRININNLTFLWYYTIYKSIIMIYKKERRSAQVDKKLIDQILRDIGLEHVEDYSEEEE